MNDNIIGLAFVVLSLSCGIIAIVCAAYNQLKKQQNSAAIRQSIIENHVDAETVKELLKQDEPKKKSKYSALIWGCALFGLGIGWLVGKLFNISEGDDFHNYIFLLGGFMGLGLIASFFIKRYFEQKDAEKRISEE